ncbi:MAG TPA: AraC family transcriptional regulator [Opitutaceae bacterium]
MRPPAFHGAVEIVQAAPAWRSFPLHISETLGICWKAGPDHMVRSDGRELVFPSRAICVRTPGCVWACEPANVGFVSIDIAPSLLPEEVARAPMHFLSNESMPDIAGLVSADDGAASDMLRLEETLTLLIDWLCRRGAVRMGGHGSARHGRRIVNRARDFLEAHLERNPSLDELARAVGANKFTLIRAFRAVLGITPHAFLIRLRVARAGRALREGATATEAAVLAGFADQAHLTRQFKRILGVTPATYGRAARRDESRVRSTLVNFVQFRSAWLG